jgi:hypothetical protein
VCCVSSCVWLGGILTDSFDSSSPCLLACLVFACDWDHNLWALIPTQNKSPRWEQKSINHCKKRWLKISESVSRFFHSKHLFVYRVTFCSPLKQMGLVSYNYRLVAKSHIHPIGYHITLILIFCHWVTRKPYNLWYPMWDEQIRNDRKYRKAPDQWDGCASYHRG